MIEISNDNRNSELEEKMNIHPGRIYRVKVAGMNPLDGLVFDGVLEKVIVTESDGTHFIKSISLSDGITYATLDAPRAGELFDNEVIHTLGEKNLRFGMILDEKGFYRVRKDIKDKRG